MTVVGTGTYYYSRDGLGSVRTLTDGSQVVQNKYAYSAFGEPYVPGTSETAGLSQRYQFQGREAGAVPGAPMFYRQRSYAAGLGRFNRRDPALGGDPLFNAYGFPTANAVMNVDPMGLGVPVDKKLSGKWKLRNVAGVPTGDQGAAVGAPGLLDGFEVEFDDSDCKCEGTIRLVQAIEVGGFMTGATPHMDVWPDDAKKNKEAKGTLPIPGYLETGGRKGNHGDKSYIDSPYNPRSITGDVTWSFTTCALCQENGKDRNMGCVNFKFIQKSKDNKITKRYLDVSGAKEKTDKGDTWYEVESKQPGSVWKKALEKWESMGKE